MSLFLIFFITSCNDSECERCSDDEQRREYDRIIDLCRYQITACENTLGFKHYDSEGYYDYGIFHSPGNCADWAAAIWNMLKSSTWNCWKIVKIRARKRWTLSFHNFIYIEPKCGGEKIYLDPFWTSGKFVYTEEEFKKKGFYHGTVWATRGTHNPGDLPK